MTKEQMINMILGGAVHCWNGSLGCSNCAIYKYCDKGERSKVIRKLEKELDVDFNDINSYSIVDLLDITPPNFYENIKRIYLGADEGGFTLEQLYEIFGTAKFSVILKENTPKMIDEKIREYENQVTVDPLSQTMQSIHKAKDDFATWEQILKTLPSVKF